MTGTHVFGDFKPFDIVLPEGKRFWEDDSTGLTIKKGQTITVQPKYFRSAELRFALLRNQLIMKNGEAVFAFKEKIVKIVPGDKKNLVSEIGSLKPEEPKVEPIQEDQKVVTKKEVKETKKSKKPDLDNIDPLIEEE